ncbi:bifunctional cytidylyltransferase/SDR family oxidoreductase [Thermopolyspora sp. NPDC052614]|uniref:bifunctional cytidylyltransferase/SDR family oxidoreductase n=1 Tax=Thermopolyspora sp. NPDC052614 TaxID=3155682 RepID=UPI003428E99E
MRNDGRRNPPAGGRSPARPVVAVVLAGGVGQRMGAGMPKQLLKVAGRTILEHSVAVFESVAEIDEIVVLMAPGHVADARELVARNGFRKVTAIVEGGASRTESTWRALAAIGERECDVLLHDAVRPLVDPAIVRECVAALATCEALEVAIASSDTIVRVDAGPDGEIVRDVPDRSSLRRTQTPQGFRLSVIREAYRRAFADPGFADRPATDDCGVVLRYLPEVPIRVVPGSEHNLKITHPLDMAIAERLFRLAGRAAPPLAGPDAVRDAFAGRTVAVFGEGFGLAGALRRYGAAVHRFRRGDGMRVEDARAVEEALAVAAKESGRVDHVVHAVEVPEVGRLADASPEAVAEVLGAGTLGPANVARAALPYLRESRGHLLFHATAGAPHGLGATVRAAVVALTEALAEEWAEYGIRVNCLDSGRVADPARPWPGFAPAMPPSSSPLSSPPPSPEAIAETALAVLASGLTGEIIDVGPAG